MENTPKTTGNLPEGFIPFRTNFEAENFCGDEYVGQDGDVVVEDIKKKYPNLKPIKMNELSPCTLNLDYTRVRVFVNNSNKVVAAPHIG